MEENEVRYRQYLQSTANLVIAFFEAPAEFESALENVKRRLLLGDIQPDKACILYRSRCRTQATPRWRVWTQLVPFESLTLPGEAQPPWLGLDRELERGMTDEECRTFFRERRHEVFEIRVSKRLPGLR